MAVTPPPTLTPAPTPAPQRGDRATFSVRVDAFITWLTTAVGQFAAVAVNVYNNAVDAYNNAMVASAQASSAISAVGAIAWVSGSTYAAGDARYSLLNYKTYRRTTAGAGTTDPRDDPANWVLISNAPAPYMRVQDQKTQGTPAQAMTSGTWIVRDINTIVGANSIPGASLGTNQVTLPPGEYSYLVTVGAGNTNIRTRIQNITDGTTLALDISSQVTRTFSGKFVLTAAKVLQIQQYATGASPIAGNSMNITGVAEIYLDAEFRQIAP